MVMTCAGRPQSGEQIAEPRAVGGPVVVATRGSDHSRAVAEAPIYRGWHPESIEFGARDGYDSNLRSRGLA